MSKYPATYYGEYLGLDKLLSCQNPLSANYGEAAHDEMLFITTHQVYEIWFKQMLHELDAALKAFENNHLSEARMEFLVARLERVIEIQKLMVSQIGLLETMRPLDFLEFREYLVPASGFQSTQFRLFENKLGVLPEQRVMYNQSAYQEALRPEDQQRIQASEEAPSLADTIEAWLERTPFLNFEGFNFWESYRQAVEERFKIDRDMIQNNTMLNPEDKTLQFKQLDKTKQGFDAFFSETAYKQLRQEGKRRFSYRAMKACLLILLYREHPILHLPYRLISALTTLDEQMTAWRYRHALMVQRMIGSRPGTGGSSGYGYLIQTLDKHRVFLDFNYLTTFLIPRSSLPKLPQHIQAQLGFAYQEHHGKS